MLQATEDEKTPLTRQLDALTNQIIIIAGLALVASIALGYFIYDQPFDIAVHLGGRLLGGGGADRPAGRGHHPAVDRDEDAGRRPAPS